MFFKSKPNQDQMKKRVAEAALEYIKPGMIVGVGTGSTVNFFIEALATKKNDIKLTVSSSEESTKRLKALGFEVEQLNMVDRVDVYIDGADECNAHRELIKGGGAALTREKICAAVADQFICIIDETKLVRQLGKFPLPVEVIPMSRSHVAKEICKLGGQPEYREGTITDNGNVILDVYNFMIENPLKMETTLNQIVGVVTNGLFAHRGADIVLIAKEDGSVEKIQ